MYRKFGLVLVILCLVLAACGAKETATPVPTPVPPADTPVPPTDTPVPPTDTPVPPTPEPEGLTAPTGDVILTVTGDLSTPNMDDTCQFDAGLFDRFAVEQTLDDPWMGDGLVYRGVTLAKIWELCGGSADAEAAVLVATDGMEAPIAAADLQAWPIMLAYQVGGEDLTNELGGPVKLVYPAEARETYADEQWMWWVAEVKIGAMPQAFSAPTGDVILTVTGDLATPNVDDTCQFDAGLFDRYAIEQTLDDPWMGDGQVYRGVTLAKIWELCGGSADAEAAVLVATDGMEVPIAAADLQAWPIMLAYQVGGEDLTNELGGPVKLVYPAEARETYADEQWMWWVAEVKIAAPMGAPTGDVILTVTGDLATPNVDDTCQFDATLFDKYAIEQTLDDPWMGDGQVYRGVTLAKIWDLCGGSAEATAAVLVATDGMEAPIAAADLQAWPIMLAYQVGGEELTNELGGPVKLVYPAEARETYADEQWMWWVVEVKIAPSLAAPTGDVILTVTGDLATPNVDDTCQFDAGLFDQYAIEQTLDDPWMGDGQVYRGVTLAKIWELCGGSPDAEAAVLVATDGMEAPIAAADLQAWPIMLAYQVGGEDLTNELGGPIKLVYPAEARETYADEQWMWWVVEVKIAASLAAPTGDVILTVTGDLATPNVDDTCQFDATLFDKYAIEQTLDDPWMGDGQVYRGVTLAKIWELCGGSADAEAAVLVATDGMEAPIAAADLQAWPIMLAYQVGGEDLTNELGGPVKLVYPAEARETYADEQWMWWVVEIKIGGE